MFHFLTKIWETITYHFSIESPVCQEIVFGSHTKNKIKKKGREKKKDPWFFFFGLQWTLVYLEQKSHEEGHNRTKRSFLSRSLGTFVNMQCFVSQQRKPHFMTSKVLCKEINKNKIFSAKHILVFMHKLFIHNTAIF